MGKAAELGARIKTARARIGDRLDKLGARMTDIENVEPRVFANAEAQISLHLEGELQALHDDLAELSNLGPVGPVGPLSASDDASPAPSPAPQQQSRAWEAVPMATVPAMTGAKWADDTLPSGVPANVAAALNITGGDQ